MDAMAFQITSLTIVYHLFRHRWKKTSKLRVTGLCEGNSPVTGEFPAQMASNAENASIWWRHHAYGGCNPQCQPGISMQYTSLLKRIQQKRLI